MMLSTVRGVSRFARRFAREEEGNSTIEFAFYFSIFFMILAAGVEIAYMNIRHSMLERSVDVVVRDIRLSTGEVPDYQQVRSRICEKAAVLENCADNLRLEMVEVDPRNFWTIEPNPDCRNAAEDPRPVRNFQHGQDNALMLMRACLKYKPMLPSTSLGKKMNTDSEGYAQMIVTSAFVQEPR